MKIRLFTLNAGSGEPISGCRVNLAVKFVAEKDLETRARDSSAEATALLQPIFGKANRGVALLATTRTDRAGCAVFDINSLGDARREILDQGLKIGLTTGLVDLVLGLADDDESLVGLLQVTGLLGFAGAAETQRNRVPMKTTDTDNLIDRLFACQTAYYLKTSIDCATSLVGAIADPDADDYRLSPASFVSRADTKIGDDGCEHLVPATLPLRQYSFYRVVVRDDQTTTEKPSFEIASIDSDLNLDKSIRWGEILEFGQTWNSLGHSLGEIKYSLPLAPGEAVKVAVIDWKREDSQSRTGATRQKDKLFHEQSVESDIDEITNASVAEDQAGESFLVGLAGGVDYAVPQSGLSAAGRLSLGAGFSHTQGTRDVSGDAQQDVHRKTVQRSNLVRSRNSSVVVQATQAESNFLSTRIVANLNRGHSITVQYYEVLRHLAVKTKLLRRDYAILVPFSPFEFDERNARRFRAQLEPVLLDDRRKDGFDALERLAAGDEIYTPPESADILASETSAGSKQRPVTLAREFALTIVSGPGQESDTAGSIQISLRRAMSSNQVLLGIGPGAGFDVKVFWQVRSNPDWTIADGPMPGRTGSFRTATTNVTLAAPVDLSIITGVVVSWAPIPNAFRPEGSSDDGWDLESLKIVATTEDGKPYTVTEHNYARPLGTLTFPRGYAKQDASAQIHTELTALKERVAALEGEVDDADDAGEPGKNATKPRPTKIGDTGDSKLLLNHLNDNQVYYNTHVWLLMDPRERRMRIAAAAGPYWNGLSDSPLAVTGNHLVFRYAGQPPEWLTKIPANGEAATKSIVTIPTRGIFAETHMGHCNALEKRDITRLWNFDELPISLLPNIESLKPMRLGEIQSIVADALDASGVTIQANPELPKIGEALAKAFELLGKPDIFRDMSAKKEVADVMAKLIEAAVPPKLNAASVGTGKNAAGAEASEMAGQASQGGSGGSSPATGASLRDYNVDGFSLVPDIKTFAKDFGLSDEETKQFAMDAVQKSTSSKSKGSTKSSKKIPVTIKTSVAVQGGVTRALDGNYEVTFNPPGDQLASPATSTLFRVAQGGNAQLLPLPPNTYTVRARYYAQSSSDLVILREPQSDSLGLNGESIVALAIDLMQRDLAGEINIDTEIQSDNVTIDSKTTLVELNIEAIVERSTQAEFEIEFDLGADFALSAENKVSFDTNKISELAWKVAAQLKDKRATLVAGLLSVFSIQSNIKADKTLKVAGSNKAKFRFAPCYLKQLALTAKKLP
jgi:hypothetical protein